MYITIPKKKRKELQWYIDQLLREGWTEVKEFYHSNPTVERVSYMIILQKQI
jgi:hypothetical protein